MENKELKFSVLGAFDWKERVELDDLQNALAVFGLKVIEHPACEGTDSYGFIISNRDLTPEELDEARGAM